MGRGTAISGTQDTGPRIVDRFASRSFFQEEEPKTTTSDGAGRNGAVLSDASKTDEAPAVDAGDAKAQVIPPELWLALSVTERARFGQCFSLLVLKALGLRSCPTQEVTT
jgi:hypothetical protein